MVDVAPAAAHCLGVAVYLKGHFPSPELLCSDQVRYQIRPAELLVVAQEHLLVRVLPRQMILVHLEKVVEFVRFLTACEVCVRTVDLIALVELMQPM